MRIYFELMVDSQRSRVSLDPAGPTEESRHLMAYRTDSNKMIAVGKNAEELREQQPEMWSNLGDKIAFIQPFSPDGFSRGAAVLAFRLYLAKAVQTLRPGLVGLLLAALFDSIDYHLQLPDFEQAAESDRREFVQALEDHRPRLHSLRINGKLVAGRG